MMNGTSDGEEGTPDSGRASGSSIAAPSKTRAATLARAIEAGSSSKEDSELNVSTS